MTYNLYGLICFDFYYPQANFEFSTENLVINHEFNGLTNLFKHSLKLFVGHYYDDFLYDLQKFYSCKHWSIKTDNCDSAQNINIKKHDKTHSLVLSFETREAITFKRINFLTYVEISLRSPSIYERNSFPNFRNYK